MKKGYSLVLLVCLVFSFSTMGLACSGFAVYGEQIIYGMNFDYHLEPEVAFFLEQRADRNVLYGSFQEGSEWYDMVGYNTEGLFVTLQMLEPRDPKNITSQPLLIPELKYIALLKASTVADVEELIGDRRLFPIPGYFYLHSLYADREGNTLIVESGVEKNHLFRNSKNYEVMTNFYHHDLPTMELKDSPEGGMDRYITAERIIKTHIQSFQIDNAWQVLKETTQGIHSRVSLLVLPEKNQVLFALSNDFSRIWSIDVEKGLLSSYQGLKDRTEVLGEEGITVSQLMTWE